MSTSTILQTFALNAAQIVGSASGATAYSYKMQVAGGTTSPIVDLTSDSPYAYTDCSGWVNYALNSVSPLHQAVLSAARLQAAFNPGKVDAYNPADPANPHRLSIHEATQPLARAFVISEVLAGTAGGSNGFVTVPFGDQVRAGDIFAYASGIYANPTDPEAKLTPGLSDVSDTGHTGIVVGTPVEVSPTLWSGTGLEAGVTAVWAVPVVDSTSVPHFQDLAAANGIPGFTQPIADSRRADGSGGYVLPANLASLPAGLTVDDLSHGGLGTGTIWFATDAAGQVMQLRFAESDPWLPNHVSATTAAEAELSLSIGRLTESIVLQGSMLDPSGNLLVTLWPQAGHTAVASPTLSGTGGLHLAGDGGVLTLSATSSFSGGVLLGQGTTLELDGLGAAGTGSITFVAGEDATLEIERGALHHGLLTNAVRGWDAGDAIDLEGMPLLTGARAMLSHGVLRVTSGGLSAVLLVPDTTPGQQITLTDNGHGGTLLHLVAAIALDSDGSGSIAGGVSGGTAGAYYSAANPDVAIAGIDPAVHYHAHGWREGRDPAPMFSTPFYLASNPDVAAADIDPLQHYEQHGWREGRSPNPIFDTQTYLAANSDVAAAGINPLQHYEQFGWREGRDPGPLFGTRDYLAANRDVAAAGVDPLEHFLAFGWREGRDPNALFDTKGYLAQYPDVAATGMNPFLHYLLHGWQEGRSPSASFDGPTYAATHPKAAGHDPLSYFLVHGSAFGQMPIPSLDWG